MTVATNRSLKTFGQPFEPRKVWSVSMAGKTRDDAIRRTTTHELGHHIHVGGFKGRYKGTDIDNVINDSFAQGRANAITGRAAANAEEYFAESYAASIFHPEELKAADPIGHEMVQKVLRLRGIIT